MILLVCMGFIYGSSYAQFETGKKMISGGLSFNTSVNDLHSNPSARELHTNFHFNASLSKFSSPLLVKGIGLTYGHNYIHNNISNPSIDNVNYAHLIGAFINRIKLQPIGRKVYLAFTGTLMAAYTFGKSSYTTSVNYTDSRSYLASLSGAIGAWYQVSPRFILTGDFNNLVSVSYNYGTYTTTNGTAVNSGNNHSVGISTGLNGIALNSFQLGLRYVLK